MDKSKATTKIAKFDIKDVSDKLDLGLKVMSLSIAAGILVGSFILFYYLFDVGLTGEFLKLASSPHVLMTISLYTAFILLTIAGVFFGSVPLLISLKITVKHSTKIKGLKPYIVEVSLLLISGVLFLVPLVTLDEWLKTQGVSVAIILFLVPLVMCFIYHKASRELKHCKQIVKLYFNVYSTYIVHLVIFMFLFVLIAKAVTDLTESDFLGWTLCIVILVVVTAGIAFAVTYENMYAYTPLLIVSIIIAISLLVTGAHKTIVNKLGIGAYQASVLVDAKHLKVISNIADFGFVAEDLKTITNNQVMLNNVWVHAISGSSITISAKEKSEHYYTFPASAILGEHKTIEIEKARTEDSNE